MAAIDILPDEILVLILRYLPRNTSRRALPYLLVCKRWSKIFEHIVYEAVTISDVQGQYAIHPARFLKMLKEKGFLSQCVQDIAFPLTMNKEPICKYVHEIIDYSLPLSKIALPSGHIDKLLPVMQKVAVPQLHTLEVFGASLLQIIQMFSSCSLRELRISQGTWVGQWGSDNFRPQEYNALPPLYELEYDGLQEREGSIETIHFVRMNAKPESLSRFLQWPRALFELEITGMRASTRAEQYTLETVTQLFDIHKQTLRRIRVGIIPQSRQVPPTTHSVVDVSSYPELHSITISNRGLFCQKPELVAARLHSPKMRHIFINFEPEDYWYHESPDDFNKDSATWIEALITEICRLRPQSTSDLVLALSIPLPSLHLIFDPAVSPRTGTNPWMDAGTWPWNYIEPLKQFAADRGVTFTSSEFDPYHSQPPIFRPGIDLNPLRILKPAFRTTVLEAKTS